MDKKTWYVIGCKEETGMYYYAEGVTNNNNILGHFPKNAVHVNACDTKKEARRLVEYWTECAKRNGNYAFAYPLF